MTAEPSDSESSPFPLTRGEKKGETYLYDATIDESRPCTPKAGPIELRLYSSDINHVTLRLSAKNCSGKEVRFLHDAQLQPSALVLNGPAKIAFTDERAIKKFDNTIHVAAFTTLAPNEERVLEEAYFVPESAGGSTIHWQSFRAGVPRGTWKAQVRFTSALASGKEGKVPNAWLGTIASNTVNVATP